MNANSLVFISLASLLISAPHLCQADGEGALQMRNSALQKMKLFNGEPVPPGFVYGLFIEDSDGCTRLIPPLGTSSTTTPGLIDLPSIAMTVPGTTVGETVQVLVRAWLASYSTNWCAALRQAPSSFGESGPAISFTLGDINSPPPLWQNLTGTSPNRLRPLSVGLLSPPPIYFDVSDVVVPASSGAATAIFTVSRRSTFPAYSCCVSLPESEVFSTVDRTAIAGVDYQPTDGTLTFAAGAATTTISVPLLSGAIAAPDKEFALTLGNPGYFTPGQRTGTAILSGPGFSTIRVNGADVIISFPSIVHRHYALEASSDLEVWAAVPNREDFVGIGGPTEVTDIGGSSFRGRFYRLRVVTP